jgi:hypothetical protein
MARFELPPDLPPEDQRAAIAALEQALGAGREGISPWTLAGRAEALRLGTLQVRHQAHGWTFRGHVPFARRGTSPLIGRGDSR